jgi:DNA-binding MarR family transcriptional regulator
MKPIPSTKPARRAVDRPFDLESFVPYRLAVLSTAVSRAIAGIYGRRFGLAIPEWRSLAVLERFAPLSARSLSERGAMDKVTVSRALKHLIARGLVARVTDTRDRRRSSLNLTPAGRRMYRAIVPVAKRAEDELLACLSNDERDAFQQMLARLLTRAR